jgi:REP element-mobilizing transposase RayT
MSTYTQILYQVVFSTKNRRKCLIKNDREELFQYIHGILKNKKCHLYRINGVADHIHIIFHLHPTVALSSLVKDIKLATTEYIEFEFLFPGFNGWQDGYGAFTYSIKAKDALIEYVINQEEHHKSNDFREEYIQMLRENRIDFNEKYLL